jgi:hypothetical protein
VTAADVEQFVTEFFCAPNRLSLIDIESRPQLEVFREQVKRLRALQLRSAILPCWRTGDHIDYYGFAFDEQEFRQLGQVLNAFIGCSYSTFVPQRAKLDYKDPIESCLRRVANRYVYKIESDNSKSPTIRHKLELLTSIQKQRSSRASVIHRSRQDMLRDFYMAVEAGRRDSAERVLGEIREEGVLDAINHLYLRVLIVCRFGTLAELRRSSDLADLLVIRRPRAITEELIALIYRSELAHFEQKGNPVACVDYFRSYSFREFPGLYQAMYGMRTPEGIKSAVLVAASTVEPETALRKSLIGRITSLDESDREWIRQFDSYFSEPPFIIDADPNARAEAYLKSGNLNAALEIALQNGTGYRSLRVLCSCALVMETLELREAIRARYEALSADDKALLRATRLSASLINEFVEPPAEISKVNPQSWSEWFNLLLKLQRWPKAVEFARRGASEWELWKDISAEELTCYLEKLQDREELRYSLPHVIDSARRDPEWPRPDWKAVYNAVMDLIAVYTDGNTDDLVVWSDMAESLLQIGLPPESYRKVCSDAQGLWDQFSCPALFDWATELLDILLYGPSGDVLSRLNLFLSVIARAQVHGFKRHLSTSQITYAKLLALDFSQPDVALEFTLKQAVEDSDKDGDCFSVLSGKIVAIYSLTERVSKRAKAILEQLCPGADVRMNADLVGSGALKNLAKNADIFVINTVSAKHSATNYIEAERSKSAVTLYHNSKGSQSLVDLIGRSL